MHILHQAKTKKSLVARDHHQVQITLFSNGRLTMRLLIASQPYFDRQYRYLGAGLKRYRKELKSLQKRHIVEIIK